MTHPYRLILFDLDGTLMDSQATILQAITAVAYDAYHLIEGGEGDGEEITAVWRRTNGW